VTGAYRVERSGPLTGQVAAPTSKSVTNRVLLLAALAEGTSVIRDPLRSDDAAAMIGAVRAFGAAVTEHGDGTLEVTGTGGRPRAPERPVDARLSGTTMRFVTALGALADGPSVITGAPPLLRRPIGPLLDGLWHLGAVGEGWPERPPVRLTGGGLDGGHVDFVRETSTQYASAVLMVAPYARGNVTVLANRSSTAAGYLDLTVDVMRAWGAEVHDIGAGWTVTAGTGYTAQEWTVEHDASAAAHLYALAVATAGEVTVTNAASTLQPDAGITEVLAAMGADVVVDGRGVTVTGAQRLITVDVDLHGMPDQVTTVAALAALADGTTRIRGVEVARGHETDRLAALATELAKVGVHVEEGPGALTIRGGSAHGPASLATYDDHRLAMAFAALAARVGDVCIEDPGCVAKTYPGFWADAADLGLAWEELT
jgi:3-phosphoshikimate 1-carboxyvinyltransferase